MLRTAEFNVVHTNYYANQKRFHADLAFGFTRDALGASGAGFETIKSGGNALKKLVASGVVAFSQFT